MWALVESGSVTQIIMRPKGLTIGDNQYPKNIFNLWSSSELEAIGIYEVVLDNTNLKNDEYYDNTNQTFTFADDTVTASYGTATAKDLATLKTLHKEKINAHAGSLLAPYDWYTLREADGGTAVPSNVNTYRTAIRTTANSMCNIIDGASDVDDLADLYVYSGDPATRDLGEWPTLLGS
jgi:hypothetical protein